MLHEGAAQGCRGRGGSAPAVGGRGATGDVLNGDEALGRVEVVEDAIVADASAPAEAGAFETNDVASVRVIRHFAERREDARAALRRQSVKLFSRGLCDDEVPGHGGAGRGLRTRRGRPRGGRARGREVRRESVPPRESGPQERTTCRELRGRAPSGSVVLPFPS